MCSERGSPRRFSWRMGAKACLALFSACHGALAQACDYLQAKEYAKVGEPVEFILHCPAGDTPQVAWEFGDTSSRTEHAKSLRAAHAYAEPGMYTVFARILGELVPHSASITIIRPPTPSAPTHSSTIVRDAPRGRIFAVNPDNNTVASLRVDGFIREFEAPVGKHPRTLALDGDGNLWVACQDDATIRILSGRDGTPVATLSLPFGSRPYGIAFSPDLKAAYVTLEAVGKLVRIDPKTRSVSATLALGPTPRALAISHDGSRILVTRHLSAMARPGAKDFGEVWDVDARTFAITRAFRLEADASEDGSTNSRGIPNDLSSITISPDGHFALVTASKANTVKGLALDGTTPDFQTTVRSLVIRLDLVANREDLALRKDVDNRSLPTSVTFDSLGRFACVTTMGTNKTPLLLTHSLGDITAVVPPDNTPDSLAQGKVHEMSPIGSVLDLRDSLLFIHYLLSRDVAVYDVSNGTSGSPRLLALIPTSAGEPMSPQVLLGKRVFYNAADTRMAKDGYLSCATCHIDGGKDGRVWDFTHKGEGLRRTTDLRGRLAGGGPVHWSANFDEIQDFEHDVRGAFGGDGFLSNEQFQSGTRSRTLGDKKAGLSPELDALAAYVASLAAIPPSPFRGSDGAMTEAGKRGKRVFERQEVGCAVCHAPPHFTDSRLGSADTPVLPGPVSVFPGASSLRTAEGFVLHDVGTFGPLSGKRMTDTLPGLDTPTLKGVWMGGPYLHDGSAATLRDVIDSANHGDKHGKTSQLNAQDKDDLIAYLNQIDDLDELGETGVKPKKASRSSGPLLSASVAGGRVRIRYRFAQEGSRNEIRMLDSRGAVISVYRVPTGAVAGVWDWDGKDGRGRSAGSGIYLLNAGVGGRTGTGVSFFLPHQRTAP
jgi:DNA-binding beta-propeller fold protein YncE/cytochrome c peroxidase